MSHVTNGKLHLRTTKHFADLANEIAHLLWKNLDHKGGFPELDAHRFPGLAQLFNEVLLKYIGECEACPDAAHCDPWARTGGGPPTRSERPPVCEEHAQRLWKEAGPELRLLLLDLEKQTCRFLSRNNPERASFSPTLSEKIHQTLQNVVGPHLIKNILSSSCNECMRSAMISQGGQQP